MKITLPRFFTGLAALVALVAVLAMGCSSVNTVEPASPEGRPTRVNDKRIITDSSLNDIAYVVSADQSTVSGDLKKIQVKLRNLTANVQNVSYQFRWYDKQGMAVNSPSTQWAVVSIEGGQTVPVSAVAPNPNAVDFQLSLLESTRRTASPFPQ